MRDLTKTGNEIVDRFKKTKPADIGDAVIRMEEEIEALLVEELDEIKKQRLAHLKVVFHRLMYGKEIPIEAEAEAETLIPIRNPCGEIPLQVPDYWKNDVSHPWQQVDTVAYKKVFKELSDAMKISQYPIFTNDIYSESPMITNDTNEAGDNS